MCCSKAVTGGRGGNRRRESSRKVPGVVGAAVEVVGRHIEIDGCGGKDDDEKDEEGAGRGTLLCALFADSLPEPNPDAKSTAPFTPVTLSAAHEARRVNPVTGWKWGSRSGSWRSCRWFMLVWCGCAPGADDERSPPTTPPPSASTAAVVAGKESYGAGSSRSRWPLHKSRFKATDVSVTIAVAAVLACPAATAAPPPRLPGKAGRELEMGRGGLLAGEGEEEVVLAEEALLKR